MLTYDRLLARVQTLSTTVTTHFEGERLRRLQNALESVIMTCKKGLKGDQEVLSPGQLKHWIERKIKSIHERCDDSLQAPTANERKRTAAEDAPAAKRQKKDEESEVRQVAAALLALCSSSPPSTPPYSTKAASPPPTINHDADVIAAGRDNFTPFPVIDRLNPAFFAGVTYAMDNIKKYGTDYDELTTDFTEYVRLELGIKEVVEPRVERTASEVTAAEGLLGMMGGGHNRGQAAGQAAQQGAEHFGGQTAGQAASKSFWNII